MDSFSIMHWLMVFFIMLPLWLLPVWPGWRILRRAGYDGVWALLLLVPVANWIGMYIFAFSQWPMLRRR